MVIKTEFKVSTVRNIIHCTLLKAPVKSSKYRTSGQEVMVGESCAAECSNKGRLLRKRFLPWFEDSRCKRLSRRGNITSLASDVKQSIILCHSIIIVVLNGANNKTLLCMLHSVISVWTWKFYTGICHRY